MRSRALHCKTLRSRRSATEVVWCRVVWCGVVWRRNPAVLVPLDALLEGVTVAAVASQRCRDIAAQKTFTRLHDKV